MPLTTSNKPPLSHNVFVDETMIMGTPIVWEDKTMKRVLTDFMEAYGTSINENKSQIIFFNMPL
jgi:hypothetical protein